mmetsp:Transcript_21776/g.61953  ORF Transcript_21776/g.61953 Transcript_21776/m.61953 type:complete len:84 (-) Transcript_21776:147-398(-)
MEPCVCVCVCVYVCVCVSGVRKKHKSPKKRVARRGETSLAESATGPGGASPFKKLGWDTCACVCVCLVVASKPREHAGQPSEE